MTANLDHRVSRLEADEGDRRLVLIPCSGFEGDDADAALSRHLAKHPEDASEEVLIVVTGF